MGIQIFASGSSKVDSAWTRHMPQRANVEAKIIEVPSKHFSIARVYRPEITDKTHLSEFNQVEGIIIDENLNPKRPPRRAGQIRFGNCWSRQSDASNPTISHLRSPALNSALTRKATAGWNSAAQESSVPKSPCRLA